MKASALIHALESLVQEHGDKNIILEIKYPDNFKRVSVCAGAVYFVKATEGFIEISNQES